MSQHDSIFSEDLTPLEHLKRFISKAPVFECDTDNRVKKTSVLLTYVCDNTVLTIDDVKTFLVSSKSADKVIVVEEKTKEDKPHFHAVAYKQSRFRIINERFFDINGEHPNIKYIGKEGISKPVQYCLKCLNHEIPVTTHNINIAAYTPEREITINRLNNIAKETNGDYEQSCSMLSQQHGMKPRDWTSSTNYLKSICRQPNRYFHSTFKFRKEDFVYDAAIEEYFRMYVNTTTKFDRYPILVVSGLTRRGKTSAIRAMGPHLYFKGDVDLTSFANVPSECKYIVMDDISNDDLVVYLKNNALMLGMEDGWTQKFLYVGKKPVENSCPVIVLQNTAHQCFTDPMYDNIISRGYYYHNSIHVEIKQHMGKELRDIEKQIVDQMKCRLRYFDREDDGPEDCEYNKKVIEQFFEKILTSPLALESSELTIQLKGFRSMAKELPVGIFGKNKVHHEVNLITSVRKKGRMNKWVEDELSQREE